MCSRGGGRVEEGGGLFGFGGGREDGGGRGPIRMTHGAFFRGKVSLCLRKIVGEDAIRRVSLVELLKYHGGREVSLAWLRRNGQVIPFEVQSGNLRGAPRRALDANRGADRPGREEEVGQQR